jgi:hypothetical protein
MSKPEAWISLEKAVCSLTAETQAKDARIDRLVALLREAGGALESLGACDQERCECPGILVRIKAELEDK